MKKKIILCSLLLGLLPNLLQSYNEDAREKLHTELAKKMFSKKRKAVLKGLLWCVDYVESDDNFNVIFSDYITMLHELAQNDDDKIIQFISIDLIKQAEKRMRQSFSDVFPRTREAKWDLISVLPIFYTCDISLVPYVSLYKKKLPRSNVPDYEQPLSKALNSYNYDLLLDYCVDYSFVDLAYQLLPKNKFKLPANKYDAVINGCSKLPFKYTIKDTDEFHDQNYYATHVVCALTCYGSQPLEQTAFSRRVFEYLWKNFHVVRYKLNDIDLVGEYLQCLKVYGLHQNPSVLEAERYLVAQQHADGAWKNPKEADDDAYDIFHPIWTSIVALHVGSRHIS